MILALQKLLQDDSAATLVEYALLLGLIALAVIVSLSKAGKNLGTLFTKVAKDVK